MLYEFLIDHKDEILDLVKNRLRNIKPEIKFTGEFEKGLVQFYTQITMILKTAAHEPLELGERNPHFTAREIKASHDMKEEIERDASQHGALAMIMGYNVIDLIHSYGFVCASITEIAYKHQFSISQREFHALNFGIDLVTAESVSQFETMAIDSNDQKHEIETRALAHALRSPLANASMAFDLIKRGAVGTSGYTAALLFRSLKKMQKLVESEMQTSAINLFKIKPITLNLSQFTHDVLAYCMYDANEKNISLKIEADEKLEVEADPHSLFGVLLNLIQNAIKFTKPGTQVWIRVFDENNTVRVEVEDRCGGLEQDPEELFKLHGEEAGNRTHSGIGLYFARKAMVAHNGNLIARNSGKSGCIFSLQLPRYFICPERNT